MTTYDPGAPSAAIAIDVAIAGPRAVGPVSSRLNSLFVNFFYDSLIFYFILISPCLVPFSIR